MGAIMAFPSICLAGGGKGAHPGTGSAATDCSTGKCALLQGSLPKTDASTYLDDRVMKL